MGPGRMMVMAAAMLLAGCAAASEPKAPGGAEASGPVLLVGNKGENSLSFVDLASGRELDRRPTGEAPHEIAISPDGARAAVVAYGGRTIDIFDVKKRRKLRTIDLSPNVGPHGLVWTADNRLIATTERSQSVAIADPDSGKLLASIPIGQQGTHMIAVTRDGTRGYTANIGSGTVSVLDLKSGRKLRDVAVGGRPEAIALSADEQVLWVGDLEGARVQAFDARSMKKLAEVATGPVPIRVAASPDGRWIVTSNFEGGSLTLIDAQTRAKLRDIPVSGTPDAEQVTILFGPEGRLYVAETGRNQVAEVDLEGGQVLRRLSAGEDGDGLAIANAR